MCILYSVSIQFLSIFISVSAVCQLCIPLFGFMFISHISVSVCAHLRSNFVYVKEKQYSRVHEDSWIENGIPFILHKVQVVNHFSQSVVDLCGFTEGLAEGGRIYQIYVKDMWEWTVWLHLGCVSKLTPLFWFWLIQIG